MEELGDRIRELRAKLNLPRAEFALLIGVSPTALFNYESGDRVPSADILLRICEETLANPQWLLMGRGPIYETDIRDACGKAAAEIVANILSSFGIVTEYDQRISLIEYAIKEINNNILAVSPNKDNSTWAMGYKLLDKEHEVKQKISSSKEKSEKSSKVQNATGTNIIQAGGNISGGINIKTTTKKVNVAIQPPDGSIGANAFLVERIKGLFNELGLRREERFGKTAYPVMYNEFKKTFAIPKTQKYTAYLLWPESRSSEIIDYLEEKLGNTIKGRKQKAATRKGHAAPYLLGESSRLHKLLGWSEQEYRARLHYMFGVTSRSALNLSQLANYVEYLKSEIDNA